MHKCERIRDKIDLILISFGICIIIYIIAFMIAGDKICGGIKEGTIYNPVVSTGPFPEHTKMGFCHNTPLCELKFYGYNGFVKEWRCKKNIFNF